MSDETIPPREFLDKLAYDLLVIDYTDVVAENARLRTALLKLAEYEPEYAKDWQEELDYVAAIDRKPRSGHFMLRLHQHNSR
jgi:hypothetical protein